MLTMKLTIHVLGGGFIFFFIFTQCLGKIPILTNTFEMGWNHQLDKNQPFM